MQSTKETMNEQKVKIAPYYIFPPQRIQGLSDQFDSLCSMIYELLLTRG